MKRVFTKFLAVASVAVLLGIDARAQTNKFVDSTSGSDANTGNSWAAAYKTFDKALDEANAATSIKTISVAKGTYYPGDRLLTDRNTAFAILRSDLKIYGGYPAGGGTRDIAGQPVVLSGDIGTVGTATDNSYHVVVISVSGTTTDSIVVDGLTIKEGYSIGAASSSTYGSYSVTQGNGAGISITTVSANRKVALRTVTLSYNQANTGGAIYNASRSAYFANCVFTRDTAEVSGGAIYNAGSTATTISGCQFSLNTANTTTASLGGGAIYSTGYTLLDIVNSTFTSNRSFREGGAIMNYVSANTASIKGCTFTSNRSSNPGGAIMNNSTRPVIDSCIFFEQ